MLPHKSELVVASFHFGDVGDVRITQVGLLVYPGIIKAASFLDTSMKISCQHLHGMVEFN